MLEEFNQRDASPYTRGGYHSSSSSEESGSLNPNRRILVPANASVTITSTHYSEGAHNSSIEEGEFDENNPQHRLIANAQDATLTMIDIVLDKLLNGQERVIHAVYGVTREKFEEALPVLIAKHVLQTMRTHELTDEFQVSQFEIRKDLEAILQFLEKNKGKLADAIASVVSLEDLEDHEIDGQ